VNAVSRNRGVFARDLKPKHPRAPRTATPLDNASKALVGFAVGYAVVMLIIIALGIASVIS
jgi:hypothetical protein